MFYSTYVAKYVAKAKEQTGTLYFWLRVKNSLLLVKGKELLELDFWPP